MLNNTSGKMSNIIENNEYERTDKLIESRMKTTHIFLTIVATITYFIFQMWLQCIDMYKISEKQDDSLMLMMIWCSFALSACIVNIFSAMNSLDVDNKFKQPLVDINRLDVLNSNLLYVSINKTAEASILILIVFPMIVGLCDKIFISCLYNYAYIIMMCLAAVMGLVQTAKTKIRILIRRCSGWLLLSTMILNTAWEMCDFILTDQEPIGLNYNNKDLIIVVLSIIVAILSIGIILFLLKNQNNKKDHNDQLCNEKEMFKKWKKENQSLFFKKNGMLIKTGEYRNALNSYKSCIQKFNMQELEEAKYRINENELQKKLQFLYPFFIGAIFDQIITPTSIVEFLFYGTLAVYLLYKIIDKTYYEYYDPLIVFRTTAIDELIKNKNDNGNRGYNN